ncbi:anillin [Tribolium castaneum]|uniref:anillin n=1 Tax=Tribolium castaneum TaxID=7070 RepID=UPI0030FF30E7
MKTIYNSTFNEDCVPEKMENLWQGSSLSSIEEIFDPIEIKKVVDSLVMSRFSAQIIKSRTRRSRSSCSESQDNVSLSSGRSDSSINTYNLSALISNPYPQPYYYENIFTCSETDPTCELSDYCSIGPSFDLMDTKLFILSQNKDQILKAIHYDDFYNKTRLSKERLEAERLLLINDLTSNLLLTRDNRFEEKNELCTGSVKIRNCYTWCDNQQLEEFFLCVVICGCKLLASEVTQIKSNGVIHFKEEFVVTGLRPDFTINIKIYCASRKAMKKSKQSFACNYAPRPEEEIPLRKSLFTLWGETYTTLQDLPKSNLMEVWMNSGRFTASIFSWTDLNVNLSGFLNVSQSEECPLWNREWCCLDGRYLQYFNYPPDESFECKPIGTIDLATCVEFKLLSREECARKQTFFLKTYFGKTVLLSCDTRTEFECWRNCIERILSAIEIWEH